MDLYMMVLYGHMDLLTSPCLSPFLLWLMRRNNIFLPYFYLADYLWLCWHLFFFFFAVVLVSIVESTLEKGMLIFLQMVLEPKASSSKMTFLKLLPC